MSHQEATLFVSSEMRVQCPQSHASIQITLDTYSHETPGLQDAAAERFDELMAPKRKSEAKNVSPEKVH